jgi:hypothetical protein
MWGSSGMSYAASPLLARLLHVINDATLGAAERTDLRVTSFTHERVRYCSVKLWFRLHGEKEVIRRFAEISFGGLVRLLSHLGELDRWYWGTFQHDSLLFVDGSSNHSRYNGCVRGRCGRNSHP